MICRRESGKVESSRRMACVCAANRTICTNRCLWRFRSPHSLSYCKHSRIDPPIDMRNDWRKIRTQSNWWTFSPSSMSNGAFCGSEKFSRVSENAWNCIQYTSKACSKNSLGPLNKRNHNRAVRWVGSHECEILLNTSSHLYRSEIGGETRMNHVDDGIGWMLLPHRIHATHSTWGYRCAHRLWISVTFSNARLDWETKITPKPAPECQKIFWMAISRRIAEHSILERQMHLLFATCIDRRIHRDTTKAICHLSIPVRCHFWIAIRLELGNDFLIFWFADNARGKVIYLRCNYYVDTLSSNLWTIGFGRLSMRICHDTKWTRKWPETPSHCLSSFIHRAHVQLGVFTKFTVYSSNE